MNEDKKILKKALVASTIMFVMTSLGHVLVYLCNRENDERDEK